ncbi:hypothetical protein EV182_008809, partial [Spiromyces aspiralis]
MYNDNSFRFAHLHVRNESDGCDKFEFCKTKECTEEVDIYGEAFKLYDTSWDGSQKWLCKWGDYVSYEWFESATWWMYQGNKFCINGTDACWYKSDQSGNTDIELKTDG